MVERDSLSKEWTIQEATEGRYVWPTGVYPGEVEAARVVLQKSKWFVPRTPVILRNIARAIEAAKSAPSPTQPNTLEREDTDESQQRSH